jgi:hypothetical protein
MAGRDTVPELIAPSSMRSAGRRRIFTSQSIGSPALSR